MVLAFTQYFAKKPELWISCKITHNFSILSEICWFSLVKHTQKIFVAEQNTNSVGKLPHSKFWSAFVDFHQLCATTFQFSKFQILERRKCRPHYILMSWVNKHVFECEQTLTWQSMSSQASVCSENNVREHCESSHLAFRTTAPMRAILAHFCVKIASV